MTQVHDAQESGTRWLLLAHQLPTQPAYLRVKVWRRLQTIGAIGFRKSMYVLPFSDDRLEDFLWTAKEIEAAGGEALVCEARMLQGVTDAQLRAQFDAAREADYAGLVAESRAIRTLMTRRRPPAKVLQTCESAVRRLRKRLADITAIDFFGAGGRQAAEALISDIEQRIRTLSAPRQPPNQAQKRPSAEHRSARTWVTRHGVKIDRVACAWLIQRFIDPKATFRFVDPDSYRHVSGELRFDMSAAEFTHRGDRCSFEVLLEEMGLTDPALRAIGEIVHDLDLKDGKFGRPETDGVRQFIAGLVLATSDDRARIQQAGVLFDNLYRSLRERPVARRPRKTR